MDCKSMQSGWPAAQHPLLDGVTKSTVTVSSPPSNLAAFSTGNTLTWSSPTISKLQALDSIDKTQKSWLGSLIALGAFVGPFVAGLLVDRIGRKPTLLLTSVLFVASWALIATSFSLPELNYPMIYVARVIAGIACGVTYTTTPMYIAEISEKSVRGAMGSVMSFFLCSGFLLEYVVGPFTSFLGLILVSAVAPVLFALTFFFMPESPYFLLMKGKKPNALRVLQWLRGCTDATYVQKEIMEMQSSVDEAASQKSQIFDLVSTKGNIRALYLSCGLVAFQQLSGISVILFYSEPIFESTGAGLSPSTCTIIVGVVMVLSAGTTPPLAKWLGMKKLLIVSAVLMALCQGVLGVFFYLKSHGNDVEPFKFLPIGCMVIYIIGYFLGFGPLSWAVMGEMFPANIKANASAVTTSFCWLLGFAITNSFASISGYFGMDFAFWLFAGFCIGALLFTAFLLPETRGLSLQEIQELLNGCTVSHAK